MEQARQYATPEQLGDPKGWEDAQLPSLGLWVRVRYLDTPDVTRLSFLPDLADFSALATKINNGKQSEVDPKEWAIENMRFQSHLVHLAVLHPEAVNNVGEINPPIKCGYCSTQDGEVEHPKALWSPTQAARLQPIDMGTVATIAIRAQAFATGVRPFSTGETPEDSPAPARSSGSIPPTSSLVPPPPSPIVTP